MTNQAKFGTIQWAIEVAKKMQSRAIAEISKRKAGITYMKNLPPSTKFYLALLTGCEYKGIKNWGKVSFKRGYMIMSDYEYQYAAGFINSNQAKEMGAKFYEGKKMIVAADCNIYGKLTLVPIR